jgi:hypothetical protein
VATEGAHAVASNGTSLISLSEQQIVSCDKADGNAGCNGGDQLPALEWLATTPGQCTEADYPYTSGGGADGITSGTAKGVATNALFNFPQGVAAAGGLVYCADSSNNLVRVIVAATGASVVAGALADAAALLRAERRAAPAHSPAAAAASTAGA